MGKPIVSWIKGLTVYTLEPCNIGKTRKVIEYTAYENLKMVCRRLAAAKTLESRDRIAKQCYHLFEGSILRDTSES